MEFGNIFLDNLFWAGSLVLVNLFVGIISMPFSSLFFKKLSDKGYSISSTIGFFIISYIVFTLTTLKLIPLNIASIVGVLFLWIGLNIFLERKYDFFKFKNIHIKQVLKINIPFLVLFLFMYFIKSYQAEIYQIERFMDYGFIKALFNTQTLPLKDIWFSGENLNYYYFSHFIGYVILRLTAIPPEPGFYVLTSWIFATMGINIFRLGKEVALLLPFKSKAFSFIAGIISAFWGIFGGVLHSVLWVYKTFTEKNSGGFLVGWYAEPTRVISGTITEIPIYTYIVAELHPHMWGMLSAVIVFTIIIALWINKDPLLTFFRREFWVLAFFLGVAFMVNSWDVVTLGILAAVTLLGNQLLIAAKGDGENYKIKNLGNNIYKKYQEVGFMVISLALLPIFAVGFSLPWKYFFEAPVSGVGIVKNMSNYIQWFSFWGQFIVIIVLYFYTILFSKLSKKYIKNFFQNVLNAHPGNVLIGFTILSVIIFWIVMELFYMKDILLDGEWYRANTFFKITTQLWIWLSIITGPIVVYVLVGLKGKFNTKVVFLIIWLVFSICSIFPIKTIWQGALENKKFKGIEQGLVFWKNKYSDDYEAYLYLEDLRKKLPDSEKMKVIIEAEGDSYKDNNYFSTFLGWQSVVGWPVHEWTWRGSYDEVGKRRGEVIEVYTGTDVVRSKEIIDKYKVDYIIVGQIENEKYKNINAEKLEKLGKIVFENKGAKVIEISH
ncbi:hypothetical protein KBD45_03820 [Candidatus Dojkabacteria bacterium]|nr:hypothetical protein [Candidatus Dojkabacteria bacterium]